jgi:hypothetical protein
MVLPYILVSEEHEHHVLMIWVLFAVASLLLMLLLTPELIIAFVIHKCEENHRVPFPFLLDQHAQPTLRLPPFRPVHIRLLELKGISNRPRCAPVHDQGIYERLVGDAQQIHRTYPELHSGNIHCSRLYGAAKYAVQCRP